MTDAEVIARLERLERDNRRLKAFAIATVILAAALGAMYATRPVPEKITAHEFNLVDGTGTTRASLGFTAYEPRLWLHGYEGKISMTTLTAPHISVSRNKGVAELGLQIPAAPYLTLHEGDKNWTDISATGLDLREGHNNRFIAARTR